jgi:hypothetical protein
MYLIVPTVIGVPNSVCLGVLNFGGGYGNGNPTKDPPVYPTNPVVAYAGPGCGRIELADWLRA